MNIAHTDLKPGDRFRLTEVEGPDEYGLTSTTTWEGTVHRVEDGRVFYGPDDFAFLLNNEDATWERLAPAEPKNLGAVVEFTSAYAETVRVVLVGPNFENALCSYTWDDILEEDANPRVLHEGWDGK